MRTEIKKLKNPEECVQLLGKWFNKERRLAFFTALIVSLLSNSALIFGLDILKRDGLKFALLYDSNNWEISLGRWGLEWIEMTRFNLAIPVVMLVISTIIIAISAIFLIELFKIKGKFSIILSSTALSVSPVFMIICLFPYTADAYSYALLFSILSMYFLYNKENKFIKYILPIILICISLSIYQSYLGVTIALAIMLPIIEILRDNKSTKEVWKKIGQSILVILGGCVLYLICTYIILEIKGVNLASYKGANSFSVSNIITSLPSSIINTYKTTFSYFFGNTIIANTNYGRDILFTCFFVLAIIILFVIIKQKKIYKKKIKMLMIFAFIACLPIRTRYY